MYALFGIKVWLAGEGGATATSGTRRVENEDISKRKPMKKLSDLSTLISGTETKIINNKASQSE